MSKSPKIHELIAAEGDRKEIAKHIMSEAITTFSKKDHHFQGHVRTITMYADDRQAENTADHKEIVETVTGKLDWVWEAVKPALDTFASKENSNTSAEARADVVVDGETILNDIPVTVLLGLERMVGNLMKMYQTIPTLDPGPKWVPDASHQLKDVYVTEHPVQTHKTEKVTDHKVLYEATKEHKAQVESFTLDRNVGKIELTRYSGLVSPATKAEWLERLSKLRIAIKEARQRGNNADVLELKVAESIQSFIHA